jgi:sugar lactone lactonase YvrE
MTALGARRGRVFIMSTGRRSSLPVGLTLFLALGLGASSCGGGSGNSSDGGNKPPPAGPGDITTIAGTGQRATQPVTAAPMAADQAMFDTPLDTAFDSTGALLILDWNGHKIRRLGSDGMVAFVVGTGIEGDACEALRADGTCPLHSSELNHMTDVTVDPMGRLVIAAWHNAKVKTADLTADAVIDTCGNGTRKYAGDGGPCKDATGTQLVSFDLPSGVLYDKAGNLFIADQSNQVIRRIGKDGVVKTVAGNCPATPGFGCPLGQGYTGDGGPAIMAKLSNNYGQAADPQGKIAFDAAGNLYIADTQNHVVRKVVPGADGIVGDGDPSEEVITTVAGNGMSGFSGDGGPATEAKLSGPRDIAFAPDGSYYIADTDNNCIRRVGTDGVISTAVGQCGPTSAFSGDGGPATAATLATPFGVSVDSQGNLIVADSGNQRIRKVVAR